MTSDLAMMQRALFHAARGQGRTTPNPMVGAVVVSADGVVVGHGWHERAGEPHAEVHALNAAGERARGGTIYVTLEPCCHFGRTGPCTRRLIDAGVTRVVAAMLDPDPRVRGKGVTELRECGIQVDVGLAGADAARLNQPFVTAKLQGRPFVVLKAATSLDAKVAARPGERTQLTSHEANRKAQLLRASVDAIAVGSETILVDDPLLTVREVQRIRPLVRVIFDRRLRTPPSSRIFSTLGDGPVIIFTAVHAESAEQAEHGGNAEHPEYAAQLHKRRSLEAAGATVLAVASLEEGLAALLKQDVSTLLVEGGPQLQSAFCATGLVDRLHLIVAPRELGRDGVMWLDETRLHFSSLSRLNAEAHGPDIWIEADVHGHR